MSSSDSSAETEAASGRFSLHGLSAAFARLTGTGKAERDAPEIADPLEEVEGVDSSAVPAGEVLSPRMIVEGMLFVGDSEGQPLTNRQMAANIRDVSPKEVDALIEELNQGYREAGTAYEIVSEGAGYRLQVCSELDFIRQRFLGRTREAKLTPSAIEVLSVVAYRQPVTADQVKKLRDASSHALLSQLVRRGLLCLERPENAPKKPTYHTTDRFNRLFRIDSPKDLPSSEDFDEN
ncbi:MAG: SMC-Scp complex subunit ScpB [Planctomycetes bacterium]|nr:SMC-Scp complex subunit ScpB [Planctomycetota bacterium]